MSPIALDWLEDADALDPLSEGLQSALSKIPLSGGLKNLLHGVPLGHPMHPVLVQVPIGAWTSAAMLDALPGMEAAADTLIAVGLLGVLPAVATGLTDWADLHDQQKRVGLVHASTNACAASFYVASLVSRRRGNRATGRLLAWVGYATAGLGGYLGGHLAYRQSAGANHSEFVTHLTKPGWHSIGPFDDLPDGEAVTRRMGDVNLMVLRRGKKVDVLANRCSHLDGPLASGTISTRDGEYCVTCPWHGSTFRLRDGGVVTGPATTPQPVFRTQVVDGSLQVMLDGAG